MGRPRPFALLYDPAVAGHLATIDRKHHSLIRRTIEEQLTYQSEVETQNRKPLERPSVFGTAWELRFGPNNRLRVFYRVDAGAQQVRILAIGLKTRERLMIGGEEFDL